SQSLQDATVEAGGSTPLSFWLGSLGDTAISVIRQHLENIQERMSMKPTTARSDMPKMHIRRLVIGTAAVLSIPLIMMQMSSDWNWNLFDFFIMGVLLMSAGLIFEFLQTKVHDTNRKILIGI